LWAAVVVPAAAYLIRAAAWHTLRPQLPEDAIVFGALLAVLLLAAWSGATQRRRDRSDEQFDGEHEQERSARQDHEV
jgi:hypothetical protein